MENIDIVRSFVLEKCTQYEDSYKIIKIVFPCLSLNTGIHFKEWVETLSKIKHGVMASNLVSNIDVKIIPERVVFNINHLNSDICDLRKYNNIIKVFCDFERLELNTKQKNVKF
jgi:hypothetical protein